MKLKHILQEKQLLVSLLVLLVFIISFEALQQLYYINRYQLADGVTFLDVLSNHAYRWVIWLLVGIPLYYYELSELQVNRRRIISFRNRAGLMIILVLLNIFIIAAIQLSLSGGLWDEFLSEYVTFFIYQKTLIYSLGYLGVIMIVHYHFSNASLKVTLDYLFEINEKQKQEYQLLKNTLDEKTLVLQVKIGNKHKVIPVPSITWIEADDYCVILHTEERSYTMRNTLKALEQQLGDDFVRVHRKAIVNIHNIEEIDYSTTLQIKLTNGVTVPLSRAKTKHLKSVLHLA